MESPITHIARQCRLWAALLLLAVAAAQPPAADGQQQPPQAAVTLDDCRAMALAGNKRLLIAQERTTVAAHQRREALAAYLPRLDLNAGYLHNSKDINILPHLPLLGFDVGNVYAGAVTLVQPLYAGGKITATNRLADYAQQALRAEAADAGQATILAVDAAYWRVVSLAAKSKMAASYAALVDTLRCNVRAMVATGVATRSDLLTVEVRRNAAEVTLTQATNGLVLARMALAQTCGLPVDTLLRLADEHSYYTSAPPTPTPDEPIDMAAVIARRDDLRALRLAVLMAEQQGRVARAAMLPSVALIGAYTVSNPNLNYGFEKKPGGAWHFGATLSIPLWHGGGDMARYRAAKAEATISRLRLADAVELASFQVSQAALKARESLATLKLTHSALMKANENLRQAELGFKAGVQTVADVMEAQTEWLSAHSSDIDAAIDVRLSHADLIRSLGLLDYPQQSTAHN